MPLFQIQDFDRPAYVIASDFKVAVAKWKTVVAKEGDYEIEDVNDPINVSMICSDRDLIF